MADVFISYKREDRESVERIARAVEESGFSVWWDDRIGPQAEWDTQIEQAISQARAVIVLWTPRSVESKWVRAEAHHANERGCLIPAILEPCAIPIAFSLNQTVNLSEWAGEANDRQWKKMMAWVEDVVRSGRRSAGASQGDTDETLSRHGLIGQTRSGEDIIDGAVVTAQTPGGTCFADGPNLPAMRVIPAGAFAMGAGANDPDTLPSEKPQRMVNLASPFAISLYPVTQAEWTMVIQQADLPYEAAIDPDLPQDAPVASVSWDAATDFAAALSQITGENYRLPSEAEWEFACRAGTTGPFGMRKPFGPDMANYDTRVAYQGSDTQSPRDRVTSVGSYPANAFGLYDMHGNVREWVEDRWHENYADAPIGGLAWIEGHSPMRVVRGGSWIDAPTILRSSARARATQTDAAPFIGFRLTRALNLFAMP